jgi:hypothetical protein
MAPSPHSVLLLERPLLHPRESEEVPPEPTDRQREALQAEVPVQTVASRRRPLVLGLLATLSVFEGYKWTGLIPSGSSHLSAAVFSRTGGLVLAALAVASVVAAVPSGAGRRSAVWALLVGAVGTLVAATLLVEVSSTHLTHLVLGAADLALATAAGTALVVVERRSRGLTRRTSSPPAGNFHRTTPVD